MRLSSSSRYRTAYLLLAVPRYWTSTAFSGALGKLGELKATSAADPFRAVTDGILGGAGEFVAKIPMFGALLAAPLLGASAALGGALGIYAANTDRIVGLGKGAARTGMDVSDFQLLSRSIGGGDAEQTEKLMHKLNKAAADASVSVVGTRSEFERLLSLDGKQFAEQLTADPVKALGVLGDQLRSMPHTLQVRAVMTLGGDEALKMLPDLLKGSKGIADAKDMISRMGLEVNDGLVSSIKTAQKLKKEVGALWEGFGNQVTIAVAPALAVISERIGKLPFGFAGMADTIIDKVGDAAEFVAGIIDGWGEGDLWGRMEPYWEKVKEGFRQGIDWIGDQFVAMIQSKVTPEFLKLPLAIGYAAGGDAIDKIKSVMSGAVDLFSSVDGVAVPGRGSAIADSVGGDWGPPPVVWGKAEIEDNARGAFDALREEYKNDAAGFASAADLLGLTAYFGEKRLEAMRFKADVLDKKNAPAVGKGELDLLANYHDRISAINAAFRASPALEFQRGLAEINQVLAAVKKADPLGPVRGAARDVAGALDKIDAGKVFGGIKNVLAGFGDEDPFAKLVGHGQKAGGALKDAFAGVGKIDGRALKNAVADIDAGARGVLDGLFGGGGMRAIDLGIGALKNGLKDGFGGILKGLPEIVEGAPNPFAGWVGMAADALAPVRGMLGGVGNLLQGPLDDGAAALAAFQQLQKLRAAFPMEQARFAGAAEQGSKDAYSAIIAFQNTPQLNVQQEMKRLLGLAVEQRQIQINQGREVIAAIKGNGIGEVGF